MPGRQTVCEKESSCPTTRPPPLPLPPPLSSSVTLPLSLASVKGNIADVSAKSYAQHTLVNIVALPLVCVRACACA